MTHDESEDDSISGSSSHVKIEAAYAFPDNNEFDRPGTERLEAYSA